jgi:hypothetical protein
MSRLCLRDGAVNEADAHGSAGAEESVGGADFDGVTDRKVLSTGPEGWGFEGGVFKRFRG